jgi:hypothetical protein
VGSAFWGLAFVVVGTLWLLDEMGILPKLGLAFSWKFVAPIAIIVVGVSMLVRRRYD